MQEWESGHMSVNLYMVYIMDRMSRFDTAEKTEQSCGLLWDWWPVLCECPILKLNLQSVINSTAAFRLIPLVLYPPEKGQFTGCPVWINNYMRLLWTGAHTHFTGCYDTGFYRILSFFFLTLTEKYWMCVSLIKPQHTNSFQQESHFFNKGFHSSPEKTLSRLVNSRSYSRLDITQFGIYSGS